MLGALFPTDTPSPQQAHYQYSTQEGGARHLVILIMKALNNIGPSIISWGMSLVTGHQCNSATDQNESKPSEPGSSASFQSICLSRSHLIDSYTVNLLQEIVKSHTKVEINMHTWPETWIRNLCVRLIILTEQPLVLKYFKSRS